VQILSLLNSVPILSDGWKKSQTYSKMRQNYISNRTYMPSSIEETQFRTMQLCRLEPRKAVWLVSLRY